MQFWKGMDIIMAILTTRYNSACLGGFVTFTAVIPFEDFGENFLNPNPNPYAGRQPLRTLYLLHGVTGDEKDWLYGTRIERYAIENNIAVVMPNGNNNFYLDNSEMERWGEFIGKELVEVSRTLFPLSRRREDTFIGGLSMGGYGAIRNGLKYSDTFSRIIALSSAMITYDISNYTDDAKLPFQRRKYAERIFGDLDKIIGSDVDPEQLYKECKNNMKIFMAIGTEDFLLEHNRRYKTFLESMGADITYFEEHGSHEWDFWDRNILKGIQWLQEK
jgi:putative tributyrin esterase